MRKSKRTIVAVRGDTQSGHAGGLLNSETLLPERDLDPDTGRVVIAGWHTPELRPVQKWLWKWHEQDRQAIGELAGRDELVLIEMGDLHQGAIFKDDLDYAALSDQVFLSQWTMIPWLEMKQLSGAWIVKGTGVHVWGNGASETLLTHMLKAQYNKKRIEIADHWILTINDYSIDIAHHGPGPGIRPWTRGNVFELYLKGILMDELVMRRDPPRAVLRGHKHHLIYRRAIHQAEGYIWELPGWITPPYCFIGSHADKVINSPSSMMVGMIALEIIDGQLLECHRFTHTVDLRTREVA